MRLLSTLPIIALAACGREQPSPAASALGPAETVEPQPVVIGVASPDLEPRPAEPGQRVVAAQVVTTPEGEVALEAVDTDHDGLRDDREPAETSDTLQPSAENAPPAGPSPPPYGSER